MRTIKYREVLWSCAYRIGLDPAKELLQDQADSLADYINGWVRRLYDDQDWPEWTITRQLIPNAGHIVPYVVQLGNISGSPSTEVIGRVFKVYLLDPSTTTEEFETPFDLYPEGIFVGFEHGPAVWIKYILACPQFSSTPWRADVTYGKNELVYLPQSGECYKSRTPGNRGHDPAILFQPSPPLTTEIVQERTPDNPGTSIQNRIIDVKLAVATSTVSIPDPPPNLSQFYIPVVDSTGLLTSAVHTANGAETLSTILGILAGQLVAALPTFTITTDVPNLTVRISGPQDFWVSGVGTNPFYVPVGGPLHTLVVHDIQTFIPATSNSFGNPQLTKVTVTQDDVSNGATYKILVTDDLGQEHNVSYVAQPSDSASQVLSGLANAISGSSDGYFMGVSPTLDLTLLTLTLSSRDHSSVNASISIPASAWWEVVQFPFALANPIIRGEVSDVFREEGQTDRADGEEKKVEQETSTAMSKFTAPEFGTLSNQQKPKSRYSIK